MRIPDELLDSLAEEYRSMTLVMTFEEYLNLNRHFIEEYKKTKKKQVH